MKRLQVVDYEDPIFDCDSQNVKYALVRVYGDSMVVRNLFGNWVLFRLEFVPLPARSEQVATPHITIKFTQTLEDRPAVLRQPSLSLRSFFRMVNKPRNT